MIIKLNILFNKWVNQLIIITLSITFIFKNKNKTRPNVYTIKIYSKLYELFLIYQFLIYEINRGKILFVNFTVSQFHFVIFKFSQSILIKNYFKVFKLD